MPESWPSPDSAHTVVFDFDGVFTDNKVWVDGTGREFARCDRSDGLAMDFVRAFKRRGQLNADLEVLSKETDDLVAARARKLGLACHHGVLNKESFLQGLLSDRHPGLLDPFEGLVYLGNDLNDLAVMTRAGFAVAPADAHPRIREVAQVVLPERGGDGFVRAFIEQWLGMDTLTAEELRDLVSDS